MIFYIIKVTNSNFAGREALLTLSARSYKNRVVIRPMVESWEDIN
jgi:hypothetical protein